MKAFVLRRVIPVIAIALALSSQALAQSANKVGGSIGDYVVVGGERWLVTGEWSLSAEGDSGRGNFSAALLGVPRDSPPLYPVSAPHTHHVSIVDGVVTIAQDAAGRLTLTLSGPATITGNGNLMGNSGSIVTVTLKGGTALRYSNMAMTFSQAAIDHFGSMPYHGVVTDKR